MDGVAPVPNMCVRLGRWETAPDVRAMRWLPHPGFYAPRTNANKQSANRRPTIVLRNTRLSELLYCVSNLKKLRKNMNILIFLLLASCNPLPANKEFQNPLNPCQVCVCRQTNRPDVKITCQESPQCGECDAIASNRWEYGFCK